MQNIPIIRLSEHGIGVLMIYSILLFRFFTYLYIYLYYIKLDFISIV